MTNQDTIYCSVTELNVCRYYMDGKCTCSFGVSSCQHASIHPAEEIVDKVNSGHFHEIMDRGHLICSMIDDFLIEHPGMTPTMNKQCEAAQSLISDVTNLACAEDGRLFNT